VPVAAIRAAVADLGADDARTVKLLTRAGMGWCQGRICGEAVSRLVAATAGREHDPYADALAGAARPVAVPVSLGAVAAGTAPAQPPESAPPHHGGSS
jgi:hypothetical protein